MPEDNPNVPDPVSDPESSPLNPYQEEALQTLVESVEAGAGTTAGVAAYAAASMAEIARNRPIFQRPILDANYYRERIRRDEERRQRDYERQREDYERNGRAREQQESPLNYQQSYGRGLRRPGEPYDYRPYDRMGEYSDRATSEVSNFMDRAFRGIHLTALQARHLHAMIDRSTDPYEMERERNMRDYESLDTRLITVPMKVEAKVGVRWKSKPNQGRKFRSA